MVHIKKTQNLKKIKYREKKEGIILLDPHEAKWHFEIINNWILSPCVCPCLLSFTHEVSKLCVSFRHKRGENPRVSRLVFKKLIPFLNIFAAMVSKRFRSENLCPDNKQSNMSHTHTHTHTHMQQPGQEGEFVVPRRDTKGSFPGQKPKGKRNSPRMHPGWSQELHPWPCQKGLNPKSGCYGAPAAAAGLDIQDISDSHKTLETSSPKCPSYFPGNMQAFLVAMGVVPVTNGLEPITSQTRRPRVRNECTLWQMNLDFLDTWI